MNRPISKQPLPPGAKKVFSGIIFDVYQWEQKMYDGSTKTFEKLTRPDTVLVIPMTTDGQIVLAEEEQPGKQAFLGLLGGRIEPDETPEAAASRELQEEASFKADEFVLLEATQPINKIDWAVYTFVARGCRPIAKQELDPGEKITLKPVSFDEAVELMASDEFADREGDIIRLAIQATYDPAKKAELKKLLFG